MPSHPCSHARKAGGEVLVLNPELELVLQRGRNNSCSQSQSSSFLIPYPTIPYLTTLYLTTPYFTTPMLPAYRFLFLIPPSHISPSHSSHPPLGLSHCPKTEVRAAFASPPHCRTGRHREHTKTRAGAWRKFHFPRNIPRSFSSCSGCSKQ